jgi:hypothetical protein
MAVEGVAEAVAVNVRTLVVPVTDCGKNAATTPDGMPVAVRATVPVNPPARAMETLATAVPPGAMVRPVGVTKTEKSCTFGFTVRLIATVWTIDPLVPVTTTVAGPVVAVREAVSVRRVLAPVVLGGVNTGVTPAGSPLAVKATAPANPPVRVIEIVLVPLVPRIKIRLGGAADRVKSAIEFTVTVMGVVRTKEPLVPVTVTFEVPSGVVLAAVNVSRVLLPVTGDGANEGVTPAGRPLTLKATEPANPPVRAIEIVVLPLVPGCNTTLVGVAESVKLGGTITPLAVQVIAGMAFAPGAVAVKPDAA